MTENQILMCEDDIPIIVPKKIMVFAGHPDDELISCGGTLLKYIPETTYTPLKILLV